MSTCTKRSILFTHRTWHKTPSTSNAIGILDLAAYCRQAGYTVDCYPIDCIPIRDYDLVGLSVFSSFKDEAIGDALYLKQRFVDAEIVVGGRWTKYIDASEVALLGSNCINIWSERGEEYFSPETDIDFSRYPSWSDRDLMTLQAHGTNIMSSRGCPYHCNFCHNTEKTISFFSPQRTVNNIEMLFNAGQAEVFFVDDIFTMNNNHMLGIYQECSRRNIDIRGKNRFFSHVNYINRESAEIMGMFNPIEVQIGIESGDDRMLKIMGKSFTADKAFDKIYQLSRHVPVNCLFLVGFPGENEESLSNTLRFVESVKPFITFKWVSYYQPVPKTPGYALANQHGTILDSRHDNADIAYLDCSLPKKLLTTYHDLIMNA